MDIKFDNVTKKFADLYVLKDFSIEIPEKGTICIFGPSGCGKTTFVNLLSGIIKPDNGKILGVNSKNISFVFQEDRLIPWITAKENVAAVISGKDKNIIAEELLLSVGLKDFLDKKPGELSGGMCRRIAIARALAYDSQILILDEPFRGLDLETKDSIIKLIKERQNNKLSILITHSMDEALTLSDSVYVFKGIPLSLNGILNINVEFNRRINNKEFYYKYKERLKYIMSINESWISICFMIILLY